MVINITPISASHGCNAINYALEKNRDNQDEIKPVFLGCNHLPVDDISGKPLSPDDVWEAMKIRQMYSGHKVKDPFWRIEICPSSEESKGWKLQDWQQCLQDAIRHLDNTDSVKKGKVMGHHTELRNSQWVAALHLDSNHYHIHLIANRITEENKCQDSNDDWKRAKDAADAMAEERGWVKAMEISSDRKAKIHDDAINILRNMESFSIDDYFNGMRTKGWLISATRNKQGEWVNYKIGETLYKPNHAKSSDIWIPSSKLKGRDLTISKLHRTWEPLHKYDKVHQEHSVSQHTIPQKPQASQYNVPHNAPQQEHSAAVAIPQPTVRVNVPVVSPRPRPITTSPKSKWACSEHISSENWWSTGEEVRIPDKVFDFLDEEIPSIDKMDYKDPDNEIPERTDVIAVAVFEFLMAAEAQIPSGSGGGGGSDNDLRWDGLTDDDFKKMAEYAAHRAFRRCTENLTRRGYGYRR